MQQKKRTDKAIIEQFKKKIFLKSEKIKNWKGKRDKRHLRLKMKRNEQMKRKKGKKKNSRQKKKIKKESKKG